MLIAKTLASLISGKDKSHKKWNHILLSFTAWSTAALPAPGAYLKSWESTASVAIDMAADVTRKKTANKTASLCLG